MIAEPEFDAIVSGRRLLADGVVELTLTPVEGDAPKWEPGAHVDLLLGFGLVRQYSLCGDPEDRDSLRVAVLNEPRGRGGSAWVHEQLHEGDRLTVRGPRNHFELLDAPRYLLIAGGIGITPLLPMIRAIARAGAPWQLSYGGRTRATMAYLDELADLAEPGSSGQIRSYPHDELSRIDLDSILSEPEEGTLIYCCGPEPLLAAVEERCAAWPAGSLHVERFAPRPVSDAGSSHAFEIECALSGIVVAVPVGTTILAAVEAAGITVLSSCQEGTCGTCETAVLEGIPDHRDAVLSAEERAANDVMMICCSRARSARLLLEL